MTELKHIALLWGCLGGVSCTEAPTENIQNPPVHKKASEHTIHADKIPSAAPSRHEPSQPVIKSLVPKRLDKQVRSVEWAYDARLCSASFLKTLYRLKYDTPDDALFIGDNGDFPVATEAQISTSETTLFSYKRAMQMPPKTLVGNITLETGDGCRNYRSALVYRIQRAKYPKFKPHFIHYTKRPRWVADYFYNVSSADMDESFDPSVVKMTALYRKDFIVYEIDYNATANKVKNRFRDAIRSCFKPVSSTVRR